VRNFLFTADGGDEKWLAAKKTHFCWENIMSLLSLHKRKRESLCKPGIMHSSRLDQGAAGKI